MKYVRLSLVWEPYKKDLQGIMKENYKQQEQLMDKKIHQGRSWMKVD
jgi:hypothetical protein